MEDEDMEYTDGKWKKNSTDWDELMSTSLLDREAVIEGAVHSIRNMGDVAFIILRKSCLLYTSLQDRSHVLWLHFKGSP